MRASIRTSERSDRQLRAEPTPPEPELSRPRASGTLSRDRYAQPASFLAGARAILAGAWDGVRLRCPSCSEGRLFQKGATIYPNCVACGVPFERANQGDFLGAMVTAYAMTACVALSLVLVLNLLTEVPLATQVYVVVPASLLFVTLLYRNLKGVWVAVLIGLIRWLR